MLVLANFRRNTIEGGDRVNRIQFRGLSLNRRFDNGISHVEINEGEALEPYCALNVLMISLVVRPCAFKNRIL